jgi:hypothetical protein
VPTAILAAKKPRNVLIFIKTPQGFVLLKKRVVLVKYLVAGANQLLKHKPINHSTSKPFTLLSTFFLSQTAV